MQNNLSIDIKALQNKQLDILKYFCSFCKMHDLHFFLAYGTCLGAVRHSGFIPWDDDVDLIMPPEDYTRLRMLWPEGTVREGKYTLCDTTAYYVDHHLSLTIRDNYTVYFTQGDLNPETHHGIMIEIAPISPSPTTLTGKLYQSLCACVYAIFRTQRVPNSGGRFQRGLVWALLFTIRLPMMRFRLWKWAEGVLLRGSLKNSEHARVFGQLHTIRRYYPSQLFLYENWVKFEDTKMPIPAEYDTYLTLLYGNYKVPPPEEMRVSGHNIIHVDTQMSYREYFNKSEQGRGS